MVAAAVGVSVTFWTAVIDFNLLGCLLLTYDVYMYTGY